MSHIRPLAAFDEPALLHIFQQTAHADLQAGGASTLHIAAHIWCIPYLLYTDSTCFVIDDGTGTAVGYILSVADTAAFVSWWRTTYLNYCHAQGIKPPVLKDGKPPSWNEDLDGALRASLYDPDEMLQRAHPALLEQYPAHLHVDILHEWQGKGWGRKLMDILIEKLREQEVKGVHLSMAGDNDAAGRFYEKVGLERLGEVMDGGKSGEVGREEGGSIVYSRRL